MGRALTDRERGALVALIERGVPEGAGRTVSDRRRRRWLAQVPGLRAGRRCGCGSCPSIDLEDEAGTTPGIGRRYVLEATCDGGLLLLFVDHGRPSYLELAPMGRYSFSEFPPADALEF